MVLDGQDPLNEFLRIDEALVEAIKLLEPVSDSPRLDAELLLARSLDVARSYLFAYPEETMDAAAARRFRDVIEKRTEGMPMAYITGEKEFWSMTLMVNPATLVPRPDTEMSVAPTPVNEATGCAKARTAVKAAGSASACEIRTCNSPAGASSTRSTNPT